VGTGRDHHQDDAMAAQDRLLIVVLMHGFEGVPLETLRE